MAISTIPLYGRNVMWKNGKPQQQRGSSS